jgi:hypothetical protein
MVRPVLVVKRLDHGEVPTAALVFERHADVPDLRPPPGQFESEPFEGRAMLMLECLECVAGPGPPPASAAGLGQHELGEQLTRLDDRRVAVAQPLDPAHRIGEELSRLGFDLALDGTTHLGLPTRIGRCRVLSSG